jgi:hypothetical protein
MRQRLLELAEEPGLLMPVVPGSDIVLGDGYCLVRGLRWASVERVRLDEDAVETTVEQVRELGRAAGLPHVTWWLGECTRPAGLAERLEAMGFEPDPDQPHMTSLTLDRAPAGEPAVEVRAVETVEDYLRARELDWEVWGAPEEERARQRDVQREAWPAIAADERVVHYLAYVGGEPAGFARAVYTQEAAVLLGGSTRPAARGRGVYTSLVHARWRDAVARATPRIVVSAGPMSAPILERLGFEAIGSVRLLRDRL